MSDAKPYPFDEVGELDFGVLSDHQFQSSRTWPDGSKPVAPDWNPGCSCGHSHYYFEHSRHLAEVVIAAGYRKQ